MEGAEIKQIEMEDRMRRAWNDRGFIIENEKLVGISLGYDFCAEHEWGISDIKEELGIGKKGDIGIEKNMMTEFHNDIFDYEEKKIKKGMEAVLVFNYYGSRSFKKIKEDQGCSVDIWNIGELKDYSKDNEPFIRTCWDKKAFAIHVRGKDNVNHLRKIYEAFQNKNICIGFKPDAWFGAGICLIFTDMISEEQRQAVLEKDMSQLKLLKAVEKTGIEKLLEKNNCGYFALSPMWKGENENEITFWLNPRDQQSNNYGRVSIKDLKDWAKGKGKIPMSK